MTTLSTVNRHQDDSGISRRALVRGAGLSTVAAALLAAGWRVDTVAQEATPAAQDPNAIVVLFLPPEDPEAFETYYAETHRPLALMMPNLLEILGGPAMGTLDGSEAAYHRIAILRYAGAEEMQASVESEVGQEAFGDVANFASGGVEVFLTRLEASPATGASPRPLA